ncbi:MAG: hypothetical protein AB7N76_24565 [Planctomycetota bacterium]
MRVDLLEKLVTALVVLTVLTVGGGVAALTMAFPGGLRSGVPDVAVRSDLATSDWREKWLNAKDPTRVQVTVIPDAPNRPTAPGQPAAAPQTPEAKKEEAIQKSKDYFASNQPLAPDDRVFQEVPWLKKVPGVAYRRPRRVSQFVYQKFQSFNDTWNAAQAGGGEFTETADKQTAYKINWVDPRSELATMVGLQPQDKVIAINGQPIGQSVEAGRAMYEQLKGQKKFAVMIERNGRRMVLPFYVP